LRRNLGSPLRSGKRHGSPSGSGKALLYIMENTSGLERAAFGLEQPGCESTSQTKEDEEQDSTCDTSAPQAN